MIAVVVSMSLALAAAPPKADSKPAAKTPTEKPKLAPVPAACAEAIETTGTLLDAAIAVLQAESKKGAEGDVDHGVRAFLEHLEARRSLFVAVRRNARTIHESLEEEARKLCEKHAFETIKRSLGSLSGIARFYGSRIEVFRALGDLFREPLRPASAESPRTRPDRE